MSTFANFHDERDDSAGGKASKYQKWDYIVSDHAMFTVIPY